VFDDAPGGSLRILVVENMGFVGERLEQGIDQRMPLL